MRDDGKCKIVHGFRSSFRDWAGDCTTFPREVAEAALAHMVGDDVERAYRRGDALDKRRKLMVAWVRSSPLSAFPPPLAWNQSKQRIRPICRGSILDADPPA